MNKTLGMVVLVVLFILLIVVGLSYNGLLAFIAIMLLLGFVYLADNEKCHD